MGRVLDGIHFAMDFLTQQNKRVAGDPESKAAPGGTISAKGKHVVVIGGGDTGTDCIGTSIRHGCKSLANFELLPKPPKDRAADNPWPQWPRILRTDYGHQEIAAKFGADPRAYCVMSKEFVGDENGNVAGIRTVQVEWNKVDGQWKLKELTGTDKFWPARITVTARRLPCSASASRRSRRAEISANSAPTKNAFAASNRTVSSTARMSPPI